MILPLMDIFSVFDDHYKLVVDGLWFMLWFGLFTLVTTQAGTSLEHHYNSLAAVAYKMAYPLYSASAISKMCGSAAVMTGLLWMLALLNLWGVLPYVFSVTSHISLNLSIALPMWLTIVVMSAVYNLKAFVAHFLPSGSPLFLSPFLCVIELVSQGVRPFTMAVRLTANLSAGHVILVLMASGCSLKYLPVVGLLSLYTLYEIAVCVVQAYIFTLLPTLYGDEHPLECGGT